MTELWTNRRLAEELLHVMPNMRRLFALYMRETGEEETTMMQTMVLHQIIEHPITASELAKRRRVSLQAASALVQSMVEKGWLTREPSPTDRRQFILQITPEGIAKAETVKNQLTYYMERFLEGLTEEEVVAAQTFLPALSRILNSQDTCDVKEEDKEEHTPL
ncbi:MAG: MarR family transcriptional regulator [Anaerolineae bacterium]